MKQVRSRFSRLKTSETTCSTAGCSFFYLNWNSSNSHRVDFYFLINIFLSNHSSVKFYTKCNRGHLFLNLCLTLFCTLTHIYSKKRTERQTAGAHIRATLDDSWRKEAILKGRHIQRFYFWCSRKCLLCAAVGASASTNNGNVCLKSADGRS